MTVNSGLKFKGITVDDAANVSSSSLYKYVISIDVAKQILRGSIRFTQPSAFNDPFELLPELVMPIGEPERPINIAFDIMAKRRSPPVGEVDNVPDGSRASDPTSRDVVQHLNGVIGILCLSKTIDSLLMWSHYADQYGGAVIEFDSSHEFFVGQIDVEYRTLRPKRDLGIYLSGDPVPLSELCVKSQQWEYENEVRIVRRLVDCERVATDRRGFPIYVQKIPIEAIKSVVLGERASVAAQKEVYSLLKDTNTGLLLAAVDHLGYAFRYERIKYNVPTSVTGPMMSPRTAHIFCDMQSPRGEFARWMVERHPMSKVVNKPI